MPQKGRPSRNRYRNTSDLSNGVQRANVSGNVPQQNFEAARSRFLLGATAFRTREMQKCASPFVEVKLSFSQEKLLTAHYHEPAHISHQWTCERERFASQGAKRRGRNPQRCYDPSDDRDGTAGVPSTQPVLVREPTSAFSVRWGGSYCPLCSTPRTGAQRPEEKHHHTFLRIKV